MTIPLSDRSEAQLKQFFKQLSSLPVSKGNGEQVFDKLPLAILERRGERHREFEVSIFKCMPDFQLVSEPKLPLGGTELQLVNLFCGYKNRNSNGIDYTINHKGEKYYARPLSLWISPIGFLLLPEEKVAEWESSLRDYSEFIQMDLLRFLWERIDDQFTLDYLSKLSQETLRKELIEAVSSLVMPREFQFNKNQLEDYARRLFSQNDQEQQLEINVPEIGLVEFKMPPVLKHIDKSTFGWAYQAHRLEMQKSELRHQVEHLIGVILKRHQELHQKLSEENTIPSVKKTLSLLIKKVDSLKTELKQISPEIDRLRRAYSGETTQEYELYSNNGGKDFIVTFDGIKITCLGRQFLRILHVLLSNPDQTIEMNTLYYMSKSYGRNEPLQSPKRQKISEKAQRLLDYLNGKPIMAPMLEKAKKDGQLDNYRWRLTRGIELLEKCKKDFPKDNADLHNLIEVHLQRYQYLYEEYIEIRPQDGFDAPRSGQTNYNNSNKENKKSRERISIQFKQAKKDLHNAGHSLFQSYIDQVISVVEDQGVHYYTFRPNNASPRRLRDKEWRLEP